MTEEEIIECSEYIDEINERCLNFRRISRGTGKRNAHWASQAIPMCNIQTLFDWLGFEETNPMNAIDMVRFGTGVDIEGGIIERLKLGRVFIAGGDGGASRVYLEFDELRFPIVGRIDALIEDFETSEIVPVEMKSIKDFGEKWEDKQVWKKYLPKRENIAQLLFYLLDRNQLHGVSHGYLWYQNKNRHFEALYRVPLFAKESQTIINEAVANCSYIEDVLFGEIAFPQFPCEKCKPDKFPCMWLAKDGAINGQCRYYDWCWKRKKEAQKLLEKPKNLME